MTDSHGTFMFFCSYIRMVDLYGLHSNTCYILYINCKHIILLNWSLFLSVATLSHWTSNLAVSHLECIFELLFLLVALLATHPPRECMSSWGQVELRMTSWNQGLYVKTLWKVLTWRQFPCFFFSRKHKPSFRVHFPAIYLSLLEGKWYDASGLNELWWCETRE